MHTLAAPEWHFTLILAKENNPGFLPGFAASQTTWTGNWKDTIWSINHTILIQAIWVGLNGRQ
jgi:hypothetical protein